MDEADYAAMEMERMGKWVVDDLDDLHYIAEIDSKINYLTIKIDVDDPIYLQRAATAKHVKIIGPNVHNIDYLDELKGAENLEISKTAITRLRGLEKMPVLKDVGIYQNSSLSDLGEIMESQSIETIAITGSNISPFPVIDMPIVHSFGYGRSGTTIDTKEFLLHLHTSRLHALNLSGNNISKINGFELHPNIKYLGLKDNRITAIENFEPLSHLIELDL
nr:hypothetical protein [Candidatus Sigynarchaeota archaeon]